jgi:cobalt-zinc-cadmium efflux system membrane fusion protein
MIKRISSACLSLVLLTNPMEVFAHAGHGDEFKNDTNAQPTEGIKVDASTAQKIGIKIESVVKKPLAIAITATGQIEPLPNGKVKVTTPIKGTLISLLVQAGDTVTAGQVLAVLSSPELTDLRVNALEKQVDSVASVQEANANLEFARQNYANQQQIVEAELRQAETELKIDQDRYDRDRELLASGAISRRQLQESENKFLAAKSSLSKASGRLPLLEAASQVKRSEALLEASQSKVELSGAAYSARLRQLDSQADANGKVTILAPIAGVVSDREATLGEGFEEAGKPIMTIVDDRKVLATANIYEKDISRVRVGQQVNLKVAGLPPNVTFQGRVTTIGTVVGEARVVPVKAEIGNLNGQLKSGMFAEMQVLTDKASAPVVAIPSLAVVEVQGKKVVYVQNGNSFQPTEVKLGNTSGELVAVESGLFEGDRIVTQGAPLLYAQSLRGDPKKEAEKSKEGEKVVVASNAIAMQWWLFPAAGGVIAISLGAAFWLGRRSKPEILSTHSSYLSNNGKSLLLSSHNLLSTETVDEDQSK